MGALSYPSTMQPIQADTENFKTILRFVCAFNEGGFYALNVLCSCKQKILEHFANLYPSKLATNLIFLECLCLGCTPEI